MYLYFVKKYEVKKYLGSTRLPLKKGELCEFTYEYFIIIQQLQSKARKHTVHILAGS
jgi:hypothetical protein